MITTDTEGRTFQLIFEAMHAEIHIGRDAAKVIFQNAWNESRNDYERCVAAHYLAYSETEINQKHQWNLRSIEYAGKSEPVKAAGFFPSLYLNLAKSFEDLKDLDSAEKYYRLAMEMVTALPEDTYRAAVESGIEDGLKRISEFRK